MKTETVGLWIDHRKAVIVFLSGQEEEIKLISSEIEKPHGKSGASVQADDQQQRKLTEDLNRYYDEVISALGEATDILIMGPGEAKGELKKRFAANPVAGREAEVITVDRITDRQIVAKVREHFLKRN
ncbi:MAG: hypothetical protein ACKV2V_26465 [Blastocatellia bacterium]